MVIIKMGLIHANFNGDERKKKRMSLEFLIFKLKEKKKILELTQENNLFSDLCFFPIYQFWEKSSKNETQ